MCVTVQRHGDVGLSHDNCNAFGFFDPAESTVGRAGALMSAKAYRDKKALPLVEKLKEVVKNLTIKCVQLTEQGKKLTAKVADNKSRLAA